MNPTDRITQKIIASRKRKGTKCIPTWAQAHHNEVLCIANDIWSELNLDIDSSSPLFKDIVLDK